MVRYILLSVIWTFLYSQNLISFLCLSCPSWYFLPLFIQNPASSVTSSSTRKILSFPEVIRSFIKLPKNFFHLKLFDLIWIRIEKSKTFSLSPGEHSKDICLETKGKEISFLNFLCYFLWIF
jgi:hypothetical protein